MFRSNGQARKHKREMLEAKRKNFDKIVQKEKRTFWRQKQNEIENLVDTNSKDFWKSIGRVDVGEERKKRRPMEIITEDGLISQNIPLVLKKWRDSFCELLNPVDTDISEIEQPVNVSVNGDNGAVLNTEISVGEVKGVVKAMKNKAYVEDGFPAEVLKNDCLLDILTKLFNKCFTTGVIPDIWKQGIIQPIPVSSTSDIRDPLNYRGITVTSIVYKIYCNILNKRLTLWETETSIISDAQNGFRKGRSTLDQLSTLTNVIETRKFNKQHTFAAFIDFRKAYDCINRKLLFNKLNKLGLDGNILNALKSLYDGVQCCVRVNGLKTEWFPVDCGLKQGCSLSPTLFNFFIDDLVSSLSELDVGININDEKIVILMYADDVVLLSGNEQDLQCLLDALEKWCQDNQMYVNEDKSKVVHFRAKSNAVTDTCFNICDKNIQVTNQYVYLGLLLTEHLDYKMMAKHVSKSASRALGLVISKFKAFGGLPFYTFTKLYDAIVWSTISYGAAIWGDRSFSCINTIQKVQVGKDQEKAQSEKDSHSKNRGGKKPN